ncbi:flavin-containing monooxygenase [Mesorhizobium sp. NBSH29]|uniref:flavin-containing monooxygenase n=1 Tax=Mesorhizobium sp. NBSH29 TaxID=2654249 RepID=UPI001896583C|nr:NAD(P)/FAD-dependent oxidoreductase [Mesorhizobium sp. NBSH29]
MIVIGAGAAGLAMADALSKRGIAVRVLEGENRVAEPWRRRHEQLHLNTHRALSTLAGQRFPAGTRAFPHKNVLADYLTRFAEQRQINIEFNTTVERINRAGDVWLVHHAGGVERASHVVIATGRDRIPFIPDWPGKASFRGQLLHSTDFGHASHYVGRNVLVIGAGNSGFDVLNHLVKVQTGALWLSARRGPSLLPKRIGTVAVPRFAALMDMLPLPLADRLIAVTQRLSLGDLQKHGLPAPHKGGASRLAIDQIALAVDEGAAAAIKKGRIKVVPHVETFDAEGVVLGDGTRVIPDIVIAATGYRTGLEEMVGDLDVLDETGVPRVNGVASTGQPGLWFIGMRPSLISAFRAATLDAEKIAFSVEHGH